MVPDRNGDSSIELCAPDQGRDDALRVLLHHPLRVMLHHHHRRPSGKRCTKKVAPVLGGFDQTRYATERLWATAKDGVKVGEGRVAQTCGGACRRKDRSPGGWNSR